MKTNSKTLTRVIRELRNESKRLSNAADALEGKKQPGVGGRRNGRPRKVTK